MSARVRACVKEKSASPCAVHSDQYCVVRGSTGRVLLKLSQKTNDGFAFTQDIMDEEKWTHSLLHPISSSPFAAGRWYKGKFVVTF